MKNAFLSMLLLVAALGVATAQSSKPMQIKYFCPRWGQENLPWDAFCEKVKKAGYDGVETGIPAEAKERQQLTDALKKHNLLLIGMCFYGNGKDTTERAQNFVRDVRSVATLQPILINCHTGTDFLPEAQNRALVGSIAQIAKETNVKILHETHRGRFTFAAHVTQEYLKQLPDLRLTLDISHWCNVAESYLDNQPEAVALAISRTDHLHARVGQPEAPQVSDPRAPEWKAALDKHLAWWDKVIDTRRRANAALTTVTCEFGPAGYLPTLPFTQQPVTSQWDANLFMLDLLRKRYN